MDRQQPLVFWMQNQVGTGKRRLEYCASAGDAALIPGCIHLRLNPRSLPKLFDNFCRHVLKQAFPGLNGRTVHFGLFSDVLVSILYSDSRVPNQPCSTVSCLHPKAPLVAALLPAGPLFNGTLTFGSVS